MKRKLRDMLKPSITLFLICVIVSLLLGFTNSATQDKIAERMALDAENARKEVLASADSFETVDEAESIFQENSGLATVKEAYVGFKGDSIVGYVFSVVTKGYGGEMTITVGIEDSGMISGVKIGQNQETPGLGSKAAEKPFISQLSGFVPGKPLKVVKGVKNASEEIDAISGATITSRAVVNAVQAAVDASEELLDKEAQEQ